MILIAGSAAGPRRKRTRISTLSGRLAMVRDARLGDHVGHLRHGQVNLRRGPQQGQQARQSAVAGQAGSAQLLAQYGFHRMGHSSVLPRGHG